MLLAVSNSLSHQTAIILHCYYSVGFQPVSQLTIDVHKCFTDIIIPTTVQRASMIDRKDTECCGGRISPHLFGRFCCTLSPTIAPGHAGAASSQPWRPGVDDGCAANDLQTGVIFSKDTTRPVSYDGPSQSLLVVTV